MLCGVVRRYGVPYIAEFVCYDCDVLMCVGLVYRILGHFLLCLWCAVVRRYGVLYIAGFGSFDCGVLLCFGMV